MVGSSKCYKQHRLQNPEMLGAYHPQGIDICQGSRGVQGAVSSATRKRPYAVECFAWV